MHVNICQTVQLLTAFLQCNGGKLEGAEDVVSSFIGVQIEVDLLNSVNC